MIKDAPVQNPKKVYVKVTADFGPDGRLMPKSITWRDGQVFDIDRVTEIRRAAALKAGGCGVRYTCLIGNHISFLFYEENYKWFVEAK